MSDKIWNAYVSIYRAKFKGVGINKVILNGAKMQPGETVRFTRDGSLWINENCDPQIVNEEVHTGILSLAFMRDAKFADIVLQTFSQLDGRFAASGERVRAVKTRDAFIDDSQKKRDLRNVNRLKECFDILRIFNSDPECEAVGVTTKEALAFEFVKIVLMDGSDISFKLFPQEQSKLTQAFFNFREGKYRYLVKKNDRQAIEELDRLADRLVMILTQF